MAIQHNKLIVNGETHYWGLGTVGADDQRLEVAVFGTLNISVSETTP